MSGRTEYSHQASSPNDQHLAAHFPSRPEFALFTSLSYRFQEDRRLYLLCVSIRSSCHCSSPTFTTSIFYRNYHDDLGQRTAQMFRIRVSGYVKNPVPNSFAWHDIMIAALSANHWRWLYSRLCLNPYLSVDTKKYGLSQSMGFGRACLRAIFWVI